MNKTVLANIDYRHHMTDEGDQLQEGLALAGWKLEGWGYPGERVDVHDILSANRPDVVFVQDVRDWREGSPGAFNPNVSFKNIHALAKAECKVVTVVKDAGSRVDYQRDFYREIDADAAVIYYHPRSVLELSPWLCGQTLVRTYHSIDAEKCRLVVNKRQRKRAIVSGAINQYVYPIRLEIARNATRYGVDVMGHPGYGNFGTFTPEYLDHLSEYKVSVATASRYGFALRKIIESVAVGCTPVTNLPAYDVLPEIDEALVRIPLHPVQNEISAAIDKADREWDFDRAIYFSERARAFYNWQAVGQRLSDNICKAVGL